MDYKVAGLEDAGDRDTLSRECLNWAWSLVVITFGAAALPLINANLVIGPDVDQGHDWVSVPYLCDGALVPSPSHLCVKPGGMSGAKLER
jgi:hypothetical protein